VGAWRVWVCPCWLRCAWGTERFVYNSSQKGFNYDLNYTIVSTRNTCHYYVLLLILLLQIGSYRSSSFRAYIQESICFFFCTLNFNSMKITLLTSLFFGIGKKWNSTIFFHPPATTFPYKKHCNERERNTQKRRNGEMLGGRGDLRWKRCQGKEMKQTEGSCFLFVCFFVKRTWIGLPPYVLQLRKTSKFCPLLNCHHFLYPSQTMEYHFYSLSLILSHFHLHKHNGYSIFVPFF
jgi:hypothetical protein